MQAKKQERLRQTIKELEDSIAYIDRKQNFYDEVLSGKRPYVSNLIRTENDWKKSAAVCCNKKITGKSQILFPVIFFPGAGGENRTHNLLITSEMLYHWATPAKDISHFSTWRR